MLVALIVLLFALGLYFACAADRHERERDRVFWDEVQERQRRRAELAELNDGSWTDWLDEISSLAQQDRRVA